MDTVPNALTSYLPAAIAVAVLVLLIRAAVRATQPRLPGIGLPPRRETGVSDRRTSLSALVHHSTRRQAPSTSPAQPTRRNAAPALPSMATTAPRGQAGRQPDMRQALSGRTLAAAARTTMARGPAMSGGVLVDPTSGRTLSLKWAPLLALLFGPVYFLLHRAIVPAVILLLLTVPTYGVAWLLFALLAGRILRASYLARGWREASPSQQRGQRI